MVSFVRIGSLVRITESEIDIAICSCLEYGTAQHAYFIVAMPGSTRLAHFFYTPSSKDSTMYNVLRIQ